jgi:hypothetical protein
MEGWASRAGTEPSNAQPLKANGSFPRRNSYLLIVGHWCRSNNRHDRHSRGCPDNNRPFRPPRAKARSRGRPILWRDLAIVTGTALLALAAHLIEITAWAEVFDLCREFPNFAPAFYHSAVNYTSLGYGDVVMSSSWRLLGPLETADGMLMFGVSTAMLFAVIQRLIQTRFRDADG